MGGPTHILGVLLRAGNLINKRYTAEQKKEKRQIKREETLKLEAEKRSAKASLRATKLEEKIAYALVVREANMKKKINLAELAAEAQANFYKEKMVALGLLRTSQLAAKEVLNNQQAIFMEASEKRGDAIHEVQLTTPYSVPAMKPVFESYVPCSIKVEAESISLFVNELYVRDAMLALPRGTSNDYDKFHEYVQDEFGRLFYTGKIGNFATGLKDAVTKKLWHLEEGFQRLMMMPSQDARCLITGLTVIEPDRFADEINGDVKYFMRRGRAFTCHDPLTMNIFFRSLQHWHPTFPRPYGDKRARGTKSMTDVMRLVGLVPSSCAHAHNASRFRGPRSTDPDKHHPDGDRPGAVNGKYAGGKDVPGERDGLYFRRYEYDLNMVYATARKDRHFKTK